MKIAVIGMGYVGLPLAVTFAEAGVEVVGIEADESRCGAVNAGCSYIVDVTDEALAAVVGRGLLTATSDYAATESCAADIICLPTPLNANREPDLSLVKQAAATPGRTRATRSARRASRARPTRARHATCSRRSSSRARA